jgi:hypothetical protein
MTKNTNNDLKNTTQKAKDSGTCTPLNSGDELMCSGRVSNFCSTSDIRRASIPNPDGVGTSSGTYF